MKTPPTILDARKAGPEHQVVTVEGGRNAHRRTPCEECPWRKDQVGKFPAEAFRLSARTAYDLSQHLFACHMSGSEKPAVCAGFLLRGADHNLGVRMQILREDLSGVEAIGIELHEGYREMAIANGVDPDDPVLRPCR